MNCYLDGLPLKGSQKSPLGLYFSETNLLISMLIWIPKLDSEGCGLQLEKLNMDASWKRSRWGGDSGVVLRRDNQWVHKA